MLKRPYDLKTKRALKGTESTAISGSEWMPKAGVGVEEILTALIALDRIPDLSRAISLTKGEGASGVGHAPLTYEDCLRLMLVEASTEAKDILASGLEGSTEEFNMAIEEKAAELGLDGSDMKSAIECGLRDYRFRELLGLKETDRGYINTADRGYINTTDRGYISAGKEPPDLPDYMDLISYSPRKRDEERNRLRQAFMGAKPDTGTPEGSGTGESVREKSIIDSGSSTSAGTGESTGSGAGKGAGAGERAKEASISGARCGTNSGIGQSAGAGTSASTNAGKSAGVVPGTGAAQEKTDDATIIIGGFAALTILGLGLKRLFKR